MSEKKKLAVEIVWEERLLCGGEWKSRKQIYEELLVEGFERTYVDWYLFCLSQHQPKEDLLKSLHVTGSKGDPITLCPKCHEVKEEIAAFFKVPLYPEDPQENEKGEILTAQPEMVDVPFCPMYYCQCERMAQDREGQTQGTPMPGLTLGCLVHYVSGEGRHAPAVVIEIFDAVTGRVKLRNLYNLTLDTCCYSETPVWDSWHWIEKA